MSANGFKAFVAPACDPHQSEYVASRYKVRGELSGFDGSMGIVVIEGEGGALWTDSRYFLQGAMQLEGSGLSLMKFGLEETPSIEQYLSGKYQAGEKVAVDGNLFSISQFKDMQHNLQPMELVSVSDPFDELWSERPPMPDAKIELFDIMYSGESASRKIERLKTKLSFNDNSVYLLSTLDTIAWLTNTRGGDVAFNPVYLAYCAVEADKTYLFVGKDKVDSATEQHLATQGITVVDYPKYDEYLASLSGKDVIYLPAKLSYHHYTILQSSGAELREDTILGGAAEIMKAIKNKVEIEGFKSSMLYDGIALVRFSMWLEEALAIKGHTSEMEVDAKLREFRAMSPHFKGESFYSIIGYRSNGAIVHYRVTPESNKEVSADGFLLMDSGGQYYTGTTDITRTVHLGTPTAEEKRDFTIVLKGNINLDRAIFPANTRGSQLDILARKAMLSERVNYLHGTGHGVGHYLCVHEGPQSIRKEPNLVVIEPGMVMTNEPGIYRTGKYGIRCENMMVCVEDSVSELETFLRFETITLCPFDLKCVDIEMLLPYQRKWLNNYHSMVYDKLSPHLTAKEKSWLATKTKAI